MPTVNLTRSAGRHKKRGVSVAYIELDQADSAVSGNVYELMVFPEKTLVLSAAVVIATANDDGTSATADLGIDGGNEFLNDGNITGAADTVLVGTSNDPTYLPSGGKLTWVPTLGGSDATEGAVRICVEYVETDKVTGDLTNFSATA